MPDEREQIAAEVQRMLARPDVQALPLAKRFDVAVLELAGVEYAVTVIGLLRDGRSTSRALQAFKGIMQRAGALATGERKLLDELGAESREELIHIVRAYRQAQTGDAVQMRELAMRTLEQWAAEEPEARDGIYQRVRTFTGGTVHVNPGVAGGEGSQERREPAPSGARPERRGVGADDSGDARRVLPARRRAGMRGERG